MESSKAGPAEAPQDAGIDRSTQISCSVKEEVSADGQEMGEGSHRTLLGTQSEKTLQLLLDS